MEKLFYKNNLKTLIKNSKVPGEILLILPTHPPTHPSKYSLASLDAIQKRAIRLIDESALTDSLDSLAHRGNVSALSLYYRYYHGRCSDELKSVIPPKAYFARSTRFADSQQSFAVKLGKCPTSFANTFVPMTSRNWNSLPASIFPSTYNLQTFKTRVHKHPRLHPLT